MAAPETPDQAEESLFAANTNDVDFVREAGDVARLASLQVDTALDDPEEQGLVSPQRALVRVTSGNNMPPSPRGPLPRVPKTARDRGYALLLVLQFMLAVLFTTLALLKAFDAFTAPAAYAGACVALAFIALGATLTSTNDDAVGTALNRIHVPAILVVFSLALLCGLRSYRTRSVTWALLCGLVAYLALALYVARRRALNDASYVLAMVSLSWIVPWPRVSMVAAVAQALHLILIAGLLRLARKNYLFLGLTLAHAYWTAHAGRLAVRAVVAAALTRCRTFLILHARARWRRPRRRGGARSPVAPAQDLERRLAGEGDTLRPLLRCACTTSLGTLAKAALLCPPFELMRGLAVDGLAPATRKRRREACLGRALLKGKAFGAAARDVDSVVVHQELTELSDGDAVVRGCRAGTAFVGAATALVCAALRSVNGAYAGSAYDAAPPVLSVCGSFLTGWFVAGVALEPLAASAQACILCYAEQPQALERADPILYRRFCRLAPARPPRWVEPTENPMSPRRRSLSDTDYREVAL